MLVLVWIHTVLQSDDITERIFRKSWSWKNHQTTKKVRKITQHAKSKLSTIKSNLQAIHASDFQPIKWLHFIYCWANQSETHYKQCRSWSAGWSQLIMIYNVCDVKIHTNISRTLVQVSSSGQSVPLKRICGIRLLIQPFT